MGITAHRLKTMGLIDKIISEPPGGAHRDYLTVMQSARKSLQESLKQLQGYSTELLLEKRFERLMGYGKFKEVKSIAFRPGLKMCCVNKFSQETVWRSR